MGVPVRWAESRARVARTVLSPSALRGRLFARNVDACGEPPFLGGKVEVVRKAADSRLVLGDWVYLSADVRLWLNGPGATIELGDRVYLSDDVHLWLEGPASTIELGDRVFLEEGVRLFLNGPRAAIEIGERTYVNRSAEIMSRERVTIGRGCALAPDVLIMDSDMHRLEGHPWTAPVTIGDRVWIASRAIVLKGVTIGEGAVVGAGAVVTSDVPPRAVVAGVPAKVIREGVTWR